MSVFTKLSVTSILVGQVETLRTPEDPRPNWKEVRIFFGLPTLAACGLMWSHLYLRAEIVGIIVAGASIFAGLLLNLLVLIVTIAINKTKSSQVNQSEERMTGKLLMETCANVGFCLLICISLIAFCVLALALTPSNQPASEEFAAQLTRAAVFYLGGLMMISTLQIIKRVFALVEYSVNKR